MSTHHSASVSHNALCVHTPQRELVKMQLLTRQVCEEAQGSPFLTSSRSADAAGPETLSGKGLLSRWGLPALALGVLHCDDFLNGFAQQSLRAWVARRAWDPSVSPSEWDSTGRGEAISGCIMNKLTHEWKNGVLATS